MRACVIEVLERKKESKKEFVWIERKLQRAKKMCVTDLKKLHKLLL